MIKGKKINKWIAVIICLFAMIALGGKTESIFANDKKSKEMEKILSSYTKDVSNVESIKYIPLNQKILGDKTIPNKTKVVDIGFGEYYMKVKDQKNLCILLGMRHRKVACNFVKNYQ